VKPPDDQNIARDIILCPKHNLRYNAATEEGCALCRRQAGQQENQGQATTPVWPGDLSIARMLALLLQVYSSAFLRFFLISALPFVVILLIVLPAVENIAAQTFQTSFAVALAERSLWVMLAAAILLPMATIATIDLSACLIRGRSKKAVELLAAVKKFFFVLIVAVILYATLNIGFKVEFLSLRGTAFLIGLSKGEILGELAKWGVYFVGTLFFIQFIYSCVLFPQMLLIKPGCGIFEALYLSYSKLDGWGNKLKLLIFDLALIFIVYAVSYLLKKIFANPATAANFTLFHLLAKTAIVALLLPLFHIGHTVFALNQLEQSQQKEGSGE